MRLIAPRSKFSPKSPQPQLTPRLGYSVAIQQLNRREEEVTQSDRDATTGKKLSAYLRPIYKYITLYTVLLKMIENGLRGKECAW